MIAREIIPITVRSNRSALYTLWEVSPLLVVGSVKSGAPRGFLSWPFVKE